LLEEALVDFVHLSDGSPDDGLQSDLVDDPGEAFSHVEDELDGAFGEQFLSPSSAVTDFEISDSRQLR
jgi:hypothetical protein